MRSNNTMRPFDLEKAKAGAPLVTRTGAKAVEIYFFNAPIHWPIVAAIDGVKGEGK